MGSELFQRKQSPRSLLACIGKVCWSESFCLHETEMGLAVTSLHSFSSALWYNKCYCIWKPFMHFNMLSGPYKFFFYSQKQPVSTIAHRSFTVKGIPAPYHSICSLRSDAFLPPLLELVSLNQPMSHLTLQRNRAACCQRPYGAVHAICYWFSNTDKWNNVTMWRNCYQSRMTWEKWLSSLDLKDCTFFLYYVLPRSHSNLISFFNETLRIIGSVPGWSVCYTRKLAIVGWRALFL